MGGEIGVESEPGRGTSFHVTLPLERGDGARLLQQSRDETDRAARLGGARVLLVEDNKLNQELASELLANKGIRVTSAWNGEEALEVLQKEPFDGVLMDLQMPVMDGYESTRRIRRQERFQALPIIALTADVMIGDRDKIKAAGINDLIAKPLDVHQMFSVMAKWIQPGYVSATRDEEAGLREENPGTSFPALPGIDVDRGLAMCLDRSDLYHQILRVFYQTQKGFVAAFQAARQKEGAATAGRMAHTLKGNSAIICADAVHQAAVELEKVHGKGATEETVTGALHRIEEELTPVIEGLRVFVESDD